MMIDQAPSERTEYQRKQAYIDEATSNMAYKQGVIDKFWNKKRVDNSPRLGDTPDTAICINESEYDEGSQERKVKKQKLCHAIFTEFVKPLKRPKFKALSKHQNHEHKH